MTAREINDANRKPMTEEEQRHVVEMVNNGRVMLHRRCAHTCDCGEEMWGQYIGDRDDIAEWEWKCFKCGNQLFG